MARAADAGDTFLDAALEGAAWPDALLELARACKAQVGSMVLVDRRTGKGRGFCLGVEDRWSSSFVRDEARHVAIGAHFVAPGAVFTDRSAIDRRAFVRSQFFQRWAEPSGQTDYAGVAILNDETRFVFVGLSRGPRRGAFDADELEALGRFAPQIRRAARLWIALGAEEAARRSLEAALDQVGHGVFLVEADLRIAYVNAAGAARLSGGDRLCVLGDRLSCTDEMAAMRLTSAVAAAATGGAKRLTFAAAEDAGPLTLLVAPLPHGADRPAPSAAAMVIAIDPGASLRDSEAPLRAFFGLTRVEALLASRIAEGAGLKAAARVLNIAPTTARTHLGRIFAKTGARNQVELASLLAAGLPRTR